MLTYLSSEWTFTRATISSRNAELHGMYSVRAKECPGDSKYSYSGLTDVAQSLQEISIILLFRCACCKFEGEMAILDISDCMTISTEVNLVAKVPHLNRVQTA
jgi:hypothetical protein